VDDDSYTLTAQFPDDVPVWDYGASCGDETQAWDGPHFGELEFASALEVSAPGETAPLAEIEPDGKAVSSGYLAFPSPSFAGLIWFKTDDQFKPATQASFSKLIVDLMGKIGGL